MINNICERVKVMKKENQKNYNKRGSYVFAEECIYTL